MKNLKTISALLLLTSSLLFACKKEKQDTTTEEQTSSVNYGNGVVETFQRQSNGSTVIFSNWITKTSADWTGLGTSEIQTGISAPSLTDAIKNNGLVLVYFEYDGNVRILPQTWSGQGLLQVTDYSFVKEKINITMRVTGSAISGVVDIRFRYVLIPGNSLATNGRMSAPIDYKDYNAVCDYYGIPK
ncbi:MAG TPA: hypothetical protein VGQ09_14030 [Chitinophagaceae bacterium]|nr:hypothetical protein [Chitinophagaceae bacterium]